MEPDTQQKALIVTTDAGKKKHSLEELNNALRRGWRVARLAPMGGAGVGSPEQTPAIQLAALVILERQQRSSAEVMEETEEEVEEMVEEMVEGNGSGAEIEEMEEERNGGPPE